MTISENASEFYNLPVVDFESEADWKGADYAYRIRTDWDSPKEAMHQRLQALASQPEANQLVAIVIGAWMGDDSQQDSGAVVQDLTKCQLQFKSLRAIFLGDISYQENEMSWIQQSDVSSLLKAYPELQVFRVRGGNELSISSCEHESLKALIIESGGLPRSVLREVFRGSLPNLEHLELWLGTDEYGWDGGPEDLQPLLSGKLFPKLTYLGLRNSDHIDEIAPVLPNSPLLSRLKVLDLSLGNMTDVGAKSLLALRDMTNLEKLDLSHHYISPETIQELKTTLPCELVAEDAHDPNEEWRSIYVSE